jgi:RNA polymerase sigma factor (sigma-70 family)
MSTNLEWQDLFGEALIGLAKARRDWEEGRSTGSFKSFAIFYIKAELGEKLRREMVSVYVPSYIRKAFGNIKKVESLCLKYNIKPSHSVVYTTNIPEEFSSDDKSECDKYITFIKNAAERASVEYKEFVSRIYCMPDEVSYDESSYEDDAEREQQKLEAAVVVEQLRSIMSKDERIICDYIMEGYTYEEIGSMMSRSPSWVWKKVAAFKKKILT